MNKNDLYGWMITFNPETGNYRAFDRDDYLRAFSEPETNFLRSKSKDTLEELIMKAGGDKYKISKLIQ